MRSAALPASILQPLLAATSISINFHDVAKAATHAAAPAESAGLAPFQGSRWNQFGSSAGVARNTLSAPLIDGNGTPNAAALNLDLNNPSSEAAPPPDHLPPIGPSWPSTSRETPSMAPPRHSNAKECTIEDVDPKPPCFEHDFKGAEFISSDALAPDNTVIFRTKVEKPDWNHAVVVADPAATVTEEAGRALKGPEVAFRPRERSERSCGKQRNDEADGTW